MKRVYVLLALLLAAAAAAYPANAAPAEHFTEDVTGDVFVCDDAVYTVTSGTLVSTFHSGVSASGNTNFTGTLVGRRVVLEDADGNVYSLRGAVVRRYVQRPAGHGPGHLHGVPEHRQ